MADKNSNVYSLFIIIIVAIYFLFSVNLLLAAENDSHTTHQKLIPVSSVVAPASGLSGADGKGLTGITEHTGEIIPLDLWFTNEDGEKISLGSIIDRPTLLLPIYFSCPSYCPVLLANLANAVNSVIAKPAKEYKIIALSFDHLDTPPYSKQAKANYMNLLKESFPATAWTFLTGTKENVEQLTASIGYRFQEVAPRQFTHPSALICLAKGGKIIRYI